MLCQVLGNYSQDRTLKLPPVVGVVGVVGFVAWLALRVDRCRTPTCLCREVLEETGLQLSDVKQVAVENVTDHNDYHYVVIFMAGRLLDPRSEARNMEPEKCEVKALSFKLGCNLLPNVFPMWYFVCCTSAKCHRSICVPVLSRRGGRGCGLPMFPSPCLPRLGQCYSMAVTPPRRHRMAPQGSATAWLWPHRMRAPGQFWPRWLWPRSSATPNDFR